MISVRMSQYRYHRPMKHFAHHYVRIFNFSKPARTCKCSNLWYSISTKLIFVEAKCIRNIFSQPFKNFSKHTQYHTLQFKARSQKLRKGAISCVMYVCLSVRLSVCPQGTNCLPLNGFL
jgi:hypothetical protein